MTKQPVEDTIEQIFENLKEIEIKLQKKVEKKERLEGKKNSHLHILLETSLLNKIEKEAKERSISVAELVRQKLRENSQLNRIESKIDRLTKLTQ